MPIHKSQGLVQLENGALFVKREVLTNINRYDVDSAIAFKQAIQREIEALQKIVDRLDRRIQQQAQRQGVLSKQQRKDAIDWLIECFPGEGRQIRGLDEQQLVMAVHRYYSGGVTCFDWGDDTTARKLVYAYGLKQG